MLAMLPVKPRTSREHRKHLDPVLIAELYQEREWSSAQIAAHQDVTVNLVLRTLHDHGVPVRRGGPPPRRPVDDVDPRLTALYADPEITALLRRHRIPRRNRPGTITERFPTAAPVTEAFLREAYVDIGLGDHTHRAAHRSTDGTHPEPDACTRDTCSPSEFLALVGPPTTTEQDPKPRLKARRASAHSASVTSSFRSQKYSTGEPTATITCDWPE